MEAHFTYCAHFQITLNSRIPKQIEQLEMAVAGLGLGSTILRASLRSE